MHDFLKEMNCETKKRRNIDKTDEVAKFYSLNPTRYDPFGKYKIKSRSNEDLFSTSRLDEEDVAGYDAFREEGVNGYKYKIDLLKLQVY